MSTPNFIFQPGSPPKRAFTLIELLVVISIIGVLAALILGLTGLATRKSRESRVRIEMHKLINDIENYRSQLGFYPPDNRRIVNGREKGIPSPNQLYYELTGMVFTNIAGNNVFVVAGRREPINTMLIQNVFGSAGFANAARQDKDLKFTTTFKGNQVKRVVVGNGTVIDVLAVPVPNRNPDLNLRAENSSVPVNPWLYVSTSPTNNAERFDLWTEVFINGKRMRFSNWEKDPVVLP